MSPLEWLDIAGKAETAENIGLIIIGVFGTCVVFWLLSMIKRHFKTVVGCALLIAAIAFLISVL